MNQNRKNNNLNNSNTGIEFNEEYGGERIYSQETSKITGWVINSSGGLIKNKKQANYVLVGVVVLFLIISTILFSNAFSNPSEPPEGYKGNIPDLPEYRNPPTP